MTDNRIYLDYAATTPVDPTVVDAMKPYQNEIFGNPASIHSYGQEARAAIERAREMIARFIGAASEEIIFTGGGSESNNIAIQGTAFRYRKGKHIVTSAIEHHSVLNCCRFLEHEGFRISFVGVGCDGIVDPDDVKRAIDDDTVLVSIMHANNEIGTVQPIEEIGKITRERDILFHVDAVQSFGHLPIDVGTCNIDLLSSSAHKLYGPKGTGILYIRKREEVRPLVYGGDQEMGVRPSTHNVPAIVGFAEAVQRAREVLETEKIRIGGLRDMLIRGILEKIEGIRLNGHPQKRLPNNVNVSFEYIDGESLLVGLDMAGIACSTGSACSFATLEPSHVLMALGIDPEAARSGVRFSLGRYTTKSEIETVLDILPGVTERIRSVFPLYRSKR
jgi:cysteine desulfurase